MERAIFQYFNGEKETFGDPFALWRQLWLACDGQVRQWIDYASDESSPLRLAEYRGKLFDAVHRVFKMIPYDPTTNAGAQEHHVEAAIQGLLEFFIQKKTNGET